MAQQLLDEILEAARALPIEPPAPDEGDIPTFQDAVEAWLQYLEVDRRREYGTLRDARNVAKAEFLPWFG
jgi:hypothetical protein